MVAYFWLIPQLVFTIIYTFMSRNYRVSRLNMFFPNISKLRVIGIYRYTAYMMAYANEPTIRHREYRISLHYILGLSAGLQLAVLLQKPHKTVVHCAPVTSASRCLKSDSLCRTRNSWPWAVAQSSSLAKASRPKVDMTRHTGERSGHLFYIVVAKVSRYNPIGTADGNPVLWLHGKK